MTDNTDLYVIACDSQLRKGEVLFLVSEKRRAQRLRAEGRSEVQRCWWSNESRDAVVLPRQEAEKRRRTLRYNNPRLMPLALAEDISRRQLATLVTA